MPNVQHIQSNFSGGEISPRLYGRSDLQKYFNAAKTMENFNVMKLGGAVRRSGTRYVATQKDQTKVGRLIPFQYNTTQNYILEFGNLTMRIYRTSGQLIDPTPGGSPTEITTPWSESDLPDLKVTQDADVMILCHPNYTPRKLARTSADDSESSTWALTKFPYTDGPFLDVNSTSTTMYASALSGTGITITASASVFIAEDAATASESGRQIRIRHDYMDNEVSITNVTQASPAVVTAADHGFTTGERVRIEGLQNMTQLNGRVFQITHLTVNTFSLQNLAGTDIDSSAYTAYGAPGYGYVAHAPITRLHGWGTVEITAYTNATTVTADLVGSGNFKRAGSLSASDVWMLGAWSPRSSAILGQGWPHCAQYGKGRLWFANTQKSPQSFWFSRDSNNAHFSPSSRATDELTSGMGGAFTINDSQVNAIQWISMFAGGAVLLTTGGPFIVTSGDANEPISAISFNVTKQGTDGVSTRVQPFLVGNVLIFTSASNLQVHELAYNFDDNQYVTPDISIFSEHVTLGGLSQSAYQQEPDSRLWFVRADGQLVACTYDRAEKVIAWHRHIIGGTSVVVESVAVIRENNVDQVWMLVKRTINAGTKRYVEFMTPQFGISDALPAGYFSDSHVTGTVAGATTISGLTHLIGETVAVQLAGAVGSTAVVSGGGTITIPITTGVVTVGLPYTSDLVGVPLVLQGAGGDSRGRLTRPYRVDMLLHNTVGGLVSADNGANYDLITYPDSTAGSLFTGIRDIAVSDAHQLQPFIRVRQANPIPMTILSAITWLAIDGP